MNDAPEKASKADAPDALDPPAPTPRSHVALAICLAATAALLALDLGTKAWALDTLSTERLGETPPVCEPDDRGYMAMQRGRDEPIVLVENWLELRYAENCGAAFGLLRGASQGVRHTVFGTAAILASLALLFMFWRGRGKKWFAWAVPFIVSGAIGNLVDRLRLGYGVDFIRFHWRREVPFLGSEWPTFNIADVTITLGVILLLIDGWIEGREEKARERAAKARAEEAGEAAEA